MDAPTENLQLLEELIARQPVEVMERIAHHFTPSALARRRLAERDAAIRALAVGRAGSGSEIAQTIHRELCRYREALSLQELAAVLVQSLPEQRTAETRNGAPEVGFPRMTIRWRQANWPAGGEASPLEPMRSRVMRPVRKRYSRLPL